MKKTFFSLLLVGGFAVQGYCQTDAEMKAWQDYMTPGEYHKMLADETGIWDCEMTFWMEPGGQPETYKSTADVKMILGGRYQEGIYRGNMMGEAFEGKSTVGYNNASKKFVSHFIDNMGTGMMMAEGTYDKATNTINFKGQMVNPMDGKMTSYREVYTIVDADTRKIEMYDMKDGKEYKSMQIVMKRKK